jgi:PglZ domain
MNIWRDQILKEFTPKVARLTLVADPDGLLLEEGILEGISKQGFELIPFEDHIAFRYAYESKFRSRWDRGEKTDLVVVLRSQASDLGSLPYDLLQAGRKLSFSLGDIFPNLRYSVVAAMDRGDIDALYQAQRLHVPGQLGDNATKEFVLRHVFGIAPELIKQSSDLLRVLLRRHYRSQRIPDILDKRFSHLLRQNDGFRDWPLETIIPDREAFFAFLQERWPVFLDLMARQEKACESDEAYELHYSGPINLPFDHNDIRVYIDNLFLEGLLQAVSHDKSEAFSNTWLTAGIKTDPATDRFRRLSKLIESLHASIPVEDARHGDWFHFAHGWAELILLVHEQTESVPEQTSASIKDLQAQIDARFTNWLSRRYAGLINLPPVPPVMLHHIPRFLSRQITEDRNAKIALIVIDGLALDQWLVVRNALVLQQPVFRFREQTVFAWIPSLTSISRQATFAGKAPIFFPNSIQTTNKEPALWTRFWVDQGFSKNEIAYIKGLGNGSLDSVSEALSHPKVRIVGLVVDKVDKIMHGMEMGTAGMHNQVRQWTQQAYLSMLLELLMDQGFLVYLTSDHGNIETEGCGRPTEGSVADLRGERVRIYPDAVLRDRVKERFHAAHEWPSLGLPDDYIALLAPARKAFIQENQRSVGHGGISIEELIVPLVKIERITA